MVPDLDAAFDVLPTSHIMKPVKFSGTIIAKNLLFFQIKLSNLQPGPPDRATIPIAGAHDNALRRRQSFPVGAGPM